MQVSIHFPKGTFVWIQPLMNKGTTFDEKRSTVGLHGNDSLLEKHVFQQNSHVVKEEIKHLEFLQSQSAIHVF